MKKSVLFNYYKKRRLKLPKNNKDIIKFCTKIKFYLNFSKKTTFFLHGRVIL